MGCLSVGSDDAMNILKHVVRWGLSPIYRRDRDKTNNILGIGIVNVQG